MSERRGYAMITVLWVMSVGAVIALGGALAGRNGAGAERNRVQLARAEWAALGCARRAHAAADSILANAASIEAAALAWRALDARVAASRFVTAPDCDISLEAAGTRVDVTSTDDELLTTLLQSLGYGDPQPMLTALAAARDSLSDDRRLWAVPGFESVATLRTVLSTNTGRISLQTASATVLAAVPGITRETAEKIVELRDAGTPIGALSDLFGQVSAPAMQELVERFPDAARLTTVDPDAWILTSIARNGVVPSTAVLRWRLIRAGSRTTVAQTWSEF